MPFGGHCLNTFYGIYNLLPIPTLSYETDFVSWLRVTKKNKSTPTSGFRHVWSCETFIGWRCFIFRSKINAKHKLKHFFEQAKEAGACFLNPDFTNVHRVNFCISAWLQREQVSLHNNVTARVNGKNNTRRHVNEKHLPKILNLCIQ